MEVEDLLAIVLKAIEEERTEHYRAMWLTLYPHMCLGQFEYMSFEQYVDKITGRNIDLRPASEIIKDIEETHKKLKGGA